MDIIYNFTETGSFSGILSSPELLQPTDILEGTVCQPSNIIKLNSGTGWETTASTIVINDIVIQSMSESDWTASKKEEWVSAYVKHCGITCDTAELSLILGYLESIDIFQRLSGACIAYTMHNNGSTSEPPFDDGFVSGERFLGIGAYPHDFLREYAATLPINNTLRDKIYSEHNNGATYISNVCKLTYDSQTEVVYSFGCVSYPLYDTTSHTPSLENGGGSNFAEIRFAGSGLQAHYKVRKNIDPSDPTFGLCSGEGQPFCMGDEIVIVEDSCYTESTGGWSWIGDLSVVEREIYLADVTKPCEYYRNVPITDMVFPMRIIQFCNFDDFN